MSLWTFEHPAKAKAYFMIPDETCDYVNHQYGCIMCQHFRIKGRIEPVPNELMARQLEELMSCESTATAEEITAKTGLWVEEIIDEALIKLKDGRYVATYNCD
jgi:uncharacterized Fe-S cluster-containing MiaB family protein